MTLDDDRLTTLFEAVMHRLAHYESIVRHEYDSMSSDQLIIHDWSHAEIMCSRFYDLIKVLVTEVKSRPALYAEMHQDERPPEALMADFERLIRDASRGIGPTVMN